MTFRRGLALMPLLSLSLFVCSLQPIVAEAQDAAVEKKRIAFKVPMRGMPKMRVGGGVRGADTLDVGVSVLAPEEVGFSASAQPTVYWYLSDSVAQPVEFAITDTTSVQAAARPILDITLPGPVDRGVHAIELAEHGVSLKKDVQYQWFVAVVNNPEQRSEDIIAGGSIIYEPASEGLRQELSRAPDTLSAITYADFGMWYDAVDNLSRRIQSHPTDREARELRAELTEQVGLEEVAAYDREGI